VDTESSGLAFFALPPATRRTAFRQQRLRPGKAIGLVTFILRDGDFAVSSARLAAPNGTFLGMSLLMNDSVDVVIVGAGPYGLSIAAHLRGAGVGYRIFGKPMATWRDHMPAGMFLKSDGFASNLSDPQKTHTLKRFCEQTGEPYGDTGRPVRLQTFCAYGLAFQKECVPDLEQKWVTQIDLTPEGGFRITLDDGEEFQARKVVLAVGITHFNFIPPPLEGLASHLVSHSSQYGDITLLRGRSATLIGAGASACDLAAELAEGGADVTIVARSGVIYFGHPPSNQKRSLWQRIRHPSSGIGASLRSRIYCDAPWLFHMLPQRLRYRIVRRHLGPAASWTVKDKVEGRMPIWLNSNIVRAEGQNGEIRLTLQDASGTAKSHVTDHVVAATGYRVDVNRLQFLSENLRSRINVVESAPVLSQRFESSVPGLYLTGLASAPSFGPVMRFVFGVEYTATTLARHLKRSTHLKRSAQSTGLASRASIDSK
jgi:thioredoxin reductase